MQQNTRTHLIVFLALLATYAIAYGLDRWIQLTRENLSRYATGFDLLMWSWSLANLILAACLLALYTWGLLRLRRWALWVVIGLGLLVNFIPVFYWLPYWLPQEMQPFANTFFNPELLQPFLGNRGYALLVGGFTAIAGLMALVQRRAKVD